VQRGRPSGAVRSFTNLPFGLQAICGYEREAQLFQEIRLRFLGNLRVNGDKDVVLQARLVYDGLRTLILLRGSLLTMSSTPEIRVLGTTGPSRAGEGVRENAVPGMDRG
jgi:hypothetical protein